MTNIEKIRQEIERRRLHFNKEAEKYQALNNGYSQNCYGARDALRDLENFIDSLSEEPDKSLDEAAEKSSAQYYVDAGYSPFPNVETAAHKSGFIAGAEWQMKQILKEAVEGEIQMRYSGCLCAKTIRAINEDKFKFGDKVRVIIVKEEKK